MKRVVSLFLILMALVVSALPAHETLDALVTQETSIPGGIADGTPSLPAPKPEPIEFDIERSITKRVHVVESPEMPGLPAPEGKINITVQLVKDPGLPDLPPPLPALAPEDPAVLARMEELTDHYSEDQLVFVSATVYDHSRTFLRCYPSGNGHKEEISAWSNLDFNHFSGFSSFQVKGTDGKIRQYGLVMALGNENTKQREWQVEHERECQVTEIPKLPDFATSGPAYIITEGDTTDREAMELIEGMHKLYRVEGKRMEEAFHARRKAFEERKSFLLANPPKPKDVTINYWRRSR